MMLSTFKLLHPSVVRSAALRSNQPLFALRSVSTSGIKFSSPASSDESFLDTFVKTDLSRFYKSDTSKAVDQTFITPEGNHVGVLEFKFARNNFSGILSDVRGKTISSCSGGIVGFKHRSRSSPEAIKACIARLCAVLESKKTKNVIVRFSGLHHSRGSIMSFLQANSVKIVELEDITPVATAGVKPKASRRL